MKKLLYLFIFVILFNSSFSQENDLSLPFYKLNSSQLNELEMILIGAFSPVDKYMSKNEYESVLENLTLEDDQFWPIPVNLKIEKKDLGFFETNQRILLRDEQLNPVAELDVEDIYYPNVEKEEKYLNSKINEDRVYIGGKIEKIKNPIHFNFLDYRVSTSAYKENNKESQKQYGIIADKPYLSSEIKSLIKKAPEKNITLFSVDTNDSLKNHLRIKNYEKLKSLCVNEKINVVHLPYDFNSENEREVLLQAKVMSNYGVNTFFIDRNVYRNIKSSLEHYNELLKVNFIPVNIKTSRKVSSQYPEVKKFYEKPKGLCIYFVGLSGAGKSTLANALKERLLENNEERNIEIIDADVIRKYLSNELGFSDKDRSINVRRIGYVASLIVKQGGICIIANIAPFENDRLANRELISKHGKYFEVFVDTSLDVCERRDVKGLYKAARENKIKQFTGINSPFERPQFSEIKINGEGRVDAIIEEILEKLRNYDL